MPEQVRAPVPTNPTPLAPDFAHPKQLSILKKVFKAHLKPKPKTQRIHRRKKPNEWGRTLNYF
jgi:hypothetical protein